MYRKIILAFFVFFIFCSVNTWGWNAKKTHRDLSEKAAEYSALSSTGGDYLKNLGFSKNIEEPLSFNGDIKTVKEWIGEGGVEEDAGYVFTAYYYHHFHNPLAFSWNQAGLSTYYPWINGMSSILWAQNASNPWNWKTARDYYSLALTSTTNTERQTNFANTFKGLGHIIHLIQDVSQPAHVRNDPHPLDDMGIVPQFENWTKYNAEKMGLYNLPPVSPSVSFNSSAEAGYIPITQLWDINQYDGSNPPSGTAIGLSEYTNANFFSEDTINASNFPYPDITKTTITEKTAPSGTYQRQYYLKNCCGETKGNQGYLLSAVDYLDYYRLQYPSLSFALPKIPVLDDNVYSNYASLLLPRAVGYSASLLNYFFRGLINMKKDPNNPSQYVIKNESDEYMSGTFTLYYDDVSDNRRYLTSWNKAINAKSVSDSVSITEPTDAKEKGKYILVFQGIMGNETSAVVGRLVEFKESGGRVLRYAEVYEGGVRHRKVSVVEGGRETPFFDLNAILQANEWLVYRNYRSHILPIMRFDRSNWNTFVALVAKSVRFEYPYGSGSLSKAYYVNHYRVVKFHITPDFTIQYDGDIYTDTSAYYELRSWVYEPHAYCYIGEEKKEDHEFWKYVTIYDIYMINGSLKLLYMVEEKTLDFDRDYAIPVDNEGRCSWTAGTGYSNGKFEVSQTLYFGGIIKTYSYTNAIPT